MSASKRPHGPAGRKDVLHPSVSEKQAQTTSNLGLIIFFLGGGGASAHVEEEYMGSFTCFVLSASEGLSSLTDTLICKSLSDRRECYHIRLICD